MSTCYEPIPTFFPLGYRGLYLFICCVTVESGWCYTGTELVWKCWCTLQGKYSSQTNPWKEMVMLPLIHNYFITLLFPLQVHGACHYCSLRWCLAIWVHLHWSVSLNHSVLLSLSLCFIAILSSHRSGPTRSITCLVSCYWCLWSSQ